MNDVMYGVLAAAVTRYLREQYGIMIFNPIARFLMNIYLILKITMFRSLL